MAISPGPPGDPNPFLQMLAKKKAAGGGKGNPPPFMTKKKKKNTKGKSDAIARRLAAMKKK